MSVPGGRSRPGRRIIASRRGDPDYRWIRRAPYRAFGAKSIRALDCRTDCLRASAHSGRDRCRTPCWMRAECRREPACSYSMRVPRVRRRRERSVGTRKSAQGSAPGPGIDRSSAHSRPGQCACPDGRPEKRAFETLCRPDSMEACRQRLPPGRPGAARTRTRIPVRSPSRWRGRRERSWPRSTAWRASQRMKNDRPVPRQLRSSGKQWMKCGPSRSPENPPGTSSGFRRNDRRRPHPNPGLLPWTGQGPWVVPDPDPGQSESRERTESGRRPMGARSSPDPGSLPWTGEGTWAAPDPDPGQAVFRGRTGPGRCRMDVRPVSLHRCCR